MTGLHLTPGRRELPDISLEFLPADQCQLATLQQALEQLSHVAPKHRQRLVDACAACICADEEVQVEEAELLAPCATCLIVPCRRSFPASTFRGRRLLTLNHDARYAG